MKTYDPYAIRIRRRRPSLITMIALYVYMMLWLIVVVSVFIGLFR